jgi:methylated-DNA-[protein]-cysteine S-methyltransferase
MMTTMYYTLMDSPVGRLRLEASDKGLAGIKFERPERRRAGAWIEHARHPVLVETARQLREYFAGRRQSFELTLDVSGTPFQRAVWNALLTIPFGETRTYGELARQVGRPSAARAVGAANGQNPVAIVAPCHRVIGAGGALTGFAGGLDAKARLLRLEGARI